MKFNWGTGIAIFYALFMVSMILMVAKSCNNKSDLVQEDYYQKDLSYEEFRIKRINGNKYKEKIVQDFNPKNNQLTITFPNELNEIKGKLKLYRTSNKYLDKVYDLKLDSNNVMKLKLEKSTLPGLWKIQLDWTNKSQDFYNELDLII